MILVNYCLKLFLRSTQVEKSCFFCSVGVEIFFYEAFLPHDQMFLMEKGKLFVAETFLIRWPIY